uniref:Uncharacterized protein n=1 Tax=Timema cristinae TaxID=61476 RepID=A0A7R9DF27_TIMCR|nr:unnamed protein product [Timema cristinae]
MQGNEARINVYLVSHGRDRVKKRLTGRELRVGRFDLIWDDGPVWALCPGFTSCDLVLPNNPLPQRLNIFLGE